MTTTIPAAANQPLDPTPAIGGKGATKAGDAGREAGPEEAKKGTKKFLILVVGAVVLLGAAYSMVLKPMLFPPHYKPGQPVPNGKIEALPANTINLSDGHLLAVTVALQLTAPAKTATITTDSPKFLNAELTIFGALTYPDLLSPRGRGAAQGALLHLFQHIAGTSEGAQQISAIYFTSFVAQ